MVSTWEEKETLPHFILQVCFNVYVCTHGATAASFAKFQRINAGAVLPKEKHQRDKNYPSWRIVIAGPAWHAIAECEDLEAEWECREHLVWLRDNMEAECEEIPPSDVPAFLIYFFQAKMMLDRGLKDMSGVEPFQAAVEASLPRSTSVDTPRLTPSPCPPGRKQRTAPSNQTVGTPSGPEDESRGVVRCESLVPF